MQIVQCAGALPFVVDDEVADALMDYAFELATYGRRDLVRLPARDVAGVRITVSVLLGPSTELSARTGSGLEPIGDELAAPDLRRRTARLTAFTGPGLDDPVAD